jgi:C4-type Zn-finger protein
LTDENVSVKFDIKEDECKLEADINGVHYKKILIMLDEPDNCPKCSSENITVEMSPVGLEIKGFFKKRIIIVFACVKCGYRVNVDTKIKL